MEFRKNDRLYDVKPEYTGKDIMVAIDSSKTNSCMFVYNKYGIILDDYEIRGLPEDEIREQTWMQRKFLASLFMGASIVLGGIEDIITKKEEGEVMRGMKEHESRYKITAVFDSFIAYFQDNHSYTLQLINNWAWKHDTLPEEFRSGEYAHNKKGSLAYHKRIKSPYANRKDDVTDAYQIGEYLKKINGISSAVQIEGVKELSNRVCTRWLFGGRTDVGGTKEFVCSNIEYSLSDIASFMVNRLEVKELGHCKIPIQQISVDEIYTLCSGNFLKKEDSLVFAIRRES